MSSKSSRKEIDKQLHPMEDILQVRLSRLSEVITLIAGKWIAPNGLRNTDLRILNLLFDNQTLSVNELARRAHVDKAWISRSIAQLLEKKWISKQQDPNDARVQKISLTNKSRKLLEKIRPQVLFNEQILLSGLNEASLKLQLDVLMLNAENLLDEITNAKTVETKKVLKKTG